MNIHLDMYQTLAVAVLVLMLGSFFYEKKYIFWKNSVFRHPLSAVCSLRFSPVSVTAPELQNFPLMIPCGKYVWYSSLLP